MKDVQNLKDNRGIKINEVGISDLRIPLFIKSGRVRQQVIAYIKMGVDLFANIKGTHMSRFTEIAEKVKNSGREKGVRNLFPFSVTPFSAAPFSAVSRPTERPILKLIHDGSRTS